MTKTGKRVLLVVVVVLGVALAAGVVLTVRWLRPDRWTVRHLGRFHNASVLEVDLPTNVSDRWELVIRTLREDAPENERVVGLYHGEPLKLIIEGLDFNVLHFPLEERAGQYTCRLMIRASAAWWCDGVLETGSYYSMRTIELPGDYFLSWPWRAKEYMDDPQTIDLITLRTAPATGVPGYPEVVWTHKLYLRRAGSDDTAGE